jgi:phage-related holin
MKKLPLASLSLSYCCQKIIDIFFYNYYKNIYAHIMAITSLGCAMAFGFHIIEEYIFSDWKFSILLLLAVTIDTIAGVLRALKNKDFSSHSFGKLIEKFIIYSIALIAVHTLKETITNLYPQEISNPIANYIGNSIYLSILFRELWSINENINAMGYVFMPKFILKYMRDFDENGNLKAPEPDKKSDAKTENQPNY